MPKNSKHKHPKLPQIPALSAELKRIYRIVSKLILRCGFDVYVYDSKRSRTSRYIEIPISKGKRIYIRISNHPPKYIRKFDYDIYTENPRKNAWNYIDLLPVIENRLKTEKKNLKNLTKLNKRVSHENG